MLIIYYNILSKFIKKLKKMRYKINLYVPNVMQEWRLRYMNDGFLKVASSTPKICVADTEYNKKAICDLILETERCGAKVVVFPELCITGYTCNDLFLQNTLLDNAKSAMWDIVEYSTDRDMVIVIGLPLEVDSKLYNVAAVINRGHLLGLVPKTAIPNYGEFYELRHYNSGNKVPFNLNLLDNNKIMHTVPFGTNILFSCTNFLELVIGVEICEDVWTPMPPSISHALAGATVIANASASDEVTGKDSYRNQLISGQSARLVCGYIYTNAGEGESTQDLVFGGHNIIAENGNILAESRRFCNQTVYADLDLYRIRSERRRMTTFEITKKFEYLRVPFTLNVEPVKLKRYIDPAPFVPSSKSDREKRCEEILTIQAMGLKKRLEHTHCKVAVIGISGGLDSTLALLAAIKAFDFLGLDRKGIKAITMPCFGTTDRTYANACKLTRKLGAALIEIDIREAVQIHFRDIDHDEKIKDVTYENAQARERTKILMDIANKEGGMVIGTGDMSELALGWATYNGDHMSMYGVNVSVPKTLVRHLVKYYADTCENTELSAVLNDILDTPVSPELLPPEAGKISQKTEDIVGPYELHDFYLYYVLRFGYSPRKIFRMAVRAFEGAYEAETILKWMKIFYRRFFSQQFKRSCLPDGPKVGSVAVSPRGDLRMPSDASSSLWLKELETLN